MMVFLTGSLSDVLQKKRKAFCGLPCLSDQSPTGPQAQVASTDVRLPTLPLDVCHQ